MRNDTRGRRSHLPAAQRVSAAPLTEIVPHHEPGPGPHGTAASVDDALELLSCGDLTIEGRLVDASNITLYCNVRLASRSASCVYKPVQGERPLWDFPDGTLAEREVAAYLLSTATGWELIPPTVLRENGPFGRGMVQLWVDVDERVDVGELIGTDDPTLRRMAVFDAVVNNADRKGGHLLPMPDGHVYGVDHGICFAPQDKLRTVLWRWAGDPLPGDARAMLAGLDDDLKGPLGDALGELLTRREVLAVTRRAQRVLRSGRHPQPSGNWPPVPWPPF